MTPLQQLDDKSFASLALAVKSHLHQRVTGGSLRSIAAALEETFAAVLGAGRSRQELIRFVFFAAPIARRIALESADVNDRVASDISVADVKLWMWWLDNIDPLCARMIDLHYFAGLTTKETAAALKMPPSAVIRELRSAKSWLQLKLLPSESQTGTTA